MSTAVISHLLRRSTVSRSRMKDTHTDTIHLHDVTRCANYWNVHASASCKVSRNRILKSEYIMFLTRLLCLINHATSLLTNAWLQTSSFWTLLSRGQWFLVWNISTSAVIKLDNMLHWNFQQAKWRTSYLFQHSQLYPERNADLLIDVS